jgi:transglutaminase-like putative cysteine protease
VTFDKFFRASSYGMIASGALALAISGAIGGWATSLFATGLALSWWFDGTRWQLSERKALVVILLSLPLFYLDWSFRTAAFGDSPAHPGIGALAHFTLLLSSIKLFQVKADRDWTFLYLISFFQVLLAAGLTVSPAFLFSLALYMLMAVLTVVCFELRKAGRLAPPNESRLLVANNPKLLFRERSKRRNGTERAVRVLPLAALSLLLLIFALALPIFLIAPRASSSGMTLAGGTASTGYVGFSDSVTLGEIGRLQESNLLVMRVRVEGEAKGRGPLLWRGIALDHFDGHRWERTSPEGKLVRSDERSLFGFGTTEDLRRLTKQTFFIEPIDTPVLFAAPRAVAVQGTLPYLRRDADDGLSSRLHLEERVSYRVFSDAIEPDVARLRADRGRFTHETTPNLRQPLEKYLRLPPRMDTRIASLAALVIIESGARNIYDAARAIEAHLNRNQYGGGYRYSLEMRATGPDPLADFLFNVRAGHCEYFATAMAVMLRTQGFPTRIVNGFQTGEYNSAADAYSVRQADAHSWVEVYFPETDAWVTFDPTPLAGRPSGNQDTGLSASIRKYSEALELLWMQYVVSYDKQGQRTLARSLRDRLNGYRSGIDVSIADYQARFSSWWSNDSATQANTTPMLVLGLSLVFVVVVFALWKRRLRRAEPSKSAFDNRAAIPVIDFYRRMIEALEARGWKRAAWQTPHEFALAVGTPEALIITEAYHRVRYGAEDLLASEAVEMERCLQRIEEKQGGVQEF